jgi:oligopeptide/dipeptide ABC transporter ATP-binding protein
MPETSARAAADSPPPAAAVPPLLQVRDLRTYFLTDNGIAKAVDGVTFDLPAGEVLGLVGESGCGKSVTALSLLRLIPIPPGKIASGQVLFRGQDLLALDERHMRRVRGHQISMIFQEPMTSLNPVFTVGSQIIEAVTLHLGLRRAEAERRTVEMLAKVGIPDAARRVKQYPHEMSGGMRQRVMTAMALSTNPALVIADEPTTALDVTIQAQILDLLNQLRREFGMSVLLITHDLGVIAEMAHRVAVMYAGKIAEAAPVETLFAEPLHPYTQGLFRSMPRLGARKAKLEVIPGTVPDARHFPSGCKFHPRCPRAFAPCPEHEPPLEPVGPEHACACWAVFKDLGRNIP